MVPHTPRRRTGHVTLPRQWWRPPPRVLSGRPLRSSLNGCKSASIGRSPLRYAASLVVTPLQARARCAAGLLPSTPVSACRSLANCPSPLYSFLCMRPSSAVLSDGESICPVGLWVHKRTGRRANLFSAAPPVSGLVGSTNEPRRAPRPNWCAPICHMTPAVLAGMPRRATPPFASPQWRALLAALLQVQLASPSKRLACTLTVGLQPDPFYVMVQALPPRPSRRPLT